MNAPEITVDDFRRQRQALAKRMPALDGLRAFAILYVLWHNCASGSYQGGFIAKFINLCSTAGWLGVQLFFVLSGFLITGLLLDNTAAPRRFQNFYARRILRIFPPYYLLLVLICLVLPLLFPETPALRDPHGVSLWYGLFLNNWIEPFLGAHPMLPHLWSLAVEEQFYILWPACIFLLPKRFVPWLCLGAIITALATRLFFSMDDSTFATDAAYRFTIARWDALAIGAALAFFMRSENAYRTACRYAAPIFYCSVIYVIGFCALKRNYAAVGSDFKWLNQTMASFLFVTFVFYAVRIENTAAQKWQRVLLHPVLQSIGKYSYAMYLFHLPLREALMPWWEKIAANFTAHDQGWSMTVFTLIVLLCTYCLAAISWFALEQPCLKLKRYFADNYSAANKVVAN